MDKEKQRERDRHRHEEAKPAYRALMSCYPFTLDNLDGEQWKPVVGFEGYQISNFGRVKSFKKGKTNILKPTLIKDYLGVDLYTGGKKNRQKIHIIVAKAFIPNPLKKPEVNHDDGNKFNCYVGNLFWATKSETKQQIRADYATGNYSIRALARKYGYSHKTVWNIVHEEG